jgi:hypothetical protein
MLIDEFHAACERELSWLRSEFGFTEERRHPLGYALSKDGWSMAFAIEREGVLGVSLMKRGGAHEYGMEWLLEVDPEAEEFEAPQVGGGGEKLEDALRYVTRLLRQYCAPILRCDREALRRLASIGERHVNNEMVRQAERHNAEEAMASGDYLRCVAILSRLAPLGFLEERIMRKARRLLGRPPSDG